jgi:hypothetical protein
VFPGCFNHFSNYYWLYKDPQHMCEVLGGVFDPYDSFNRGDLSFFLPDNHVRRLRLSARLIRSLSSLWLSARSATVVRCAGGGVLVPVGAGPELVPEFHLHDWLPRLAVLLLCQCLARYPVWGTR